MSELRQGSISRERWRQAEDLFLATLECPPEKRRAFLDRACTADPELRREVESLLEADRRASGVLEDAVAAEARLLGDDRGAERLGRKIGPYRLLSTLGRGGMSVVYLALRDDDQYRQHVAVKLLKRGMDSDEIARRFRQERQILACLEHPGIARLLDGGTTDDGLGYLVMEHVTGIPIDRYCDEHRLTISQRLRLFTAVCSAVHFAHQNLVVHRDLKPSNILVTPEGVPKLLDFGIAKLLDPDQMPLTVVETAAAARIMTPEYASPEQVRGTPVTTASDVYSLGVLLYELLTGRRPYRFDTRQPQELERIICNEEPVRPSVAAGRVGDRQAESATRKGRTRKLRRRLAGDLDTIVLMAMHKEPRRRYASVEQLTGDLELHLAGLPVLARKDTLRYRGAKFVRRHRLGVTLAVLIAATVVTSALVTAWQAYLARQAQARAEAALVQVRAERENAEEVLAFVEDLFDVADPEVAPGRGITARELLERGAESIAARLEDQPEARARLIGSMARIHGNLGLHDEAIRLHEEALRHWPRQRFGPERVSGLNELARTLYESGRNERAENVFREALEIGREIWGERAETRVADSLDGLGVALLRRGQDGAESFLRRGLVMRRQLFGETHQDVARSLHNLGSLLYARGELAAAESLLRRSLAVKYELWGEEHPKFAPTLANLATLLYKKHDYPAAEAEYRRVLALRRKLLGEQHPDVARTLTSLATVLSDQEKHAEALALHEKALAMKYELLANDDPSIAMSLLGLGKTLHGLGRHAPAEARLRRSLELLRGRLPAGHRALAEPMETLARVLEARGETREAETLRREAREISAAGFKGKPKQESPASSDRPGRSGHRD